MTLATVYVLMLLSGPVHFPTYSDCTNFRLQLQSQPSKTHEVLPRCIKTTMYVKQ